MPDLGLIKQEKQVKTLVFGRTAPTLRQDSESQEWWESSYF
jgi:hypothetical protein